MPIVQTYGAPKVAPTALPGARLSAADTAESLGAGLDIANANKDMAVAGLAGQASRIGLDAAGKMIQDSRDQADQTALLGASNQLSDAENKLLYDPNDGALTVKGKDAMGLPESVGQSFSDTADQIAAGLTTPRQKEAFDRMRADRSQALDLTLRRHVFGEMQTYEAGELQSFVDNAKNAAMANAQDPTRVGVEINNAVSAIQQSAPRLGLGPEQIQKQTDAVRSDIHVGVIDNLLTAGKDSAASVYFDEVKDQISGAALARVQAAIDEGSIRGQAQKASDDIIAAGGSLTDQLAKAKQIDDPKLRDAVSERLDRQASLDASAARAQSEDQLRQAYNIVDKTADVNQIPPAQWSQLNGSSRDALRLYADRLAKGTPAVTDPVTYYSLMNQAGTDPGEFSKANLLAARTKLDAADFKQLVDVQLSIRNGDRQKTDQQLAGFRTRNQILDDSLAAYGFDLKDAEKNPTSDKAKAIGELRRMVDDEVARQQAPVTNADGTVTPGKKVDDEGVQLIIDKALSQQTAGSPGSWWNLIPGAGFFNGRWFGFGVMGDNPKPLIETTVGDIPAADLAKIDAALKAANKPISDATRLDLYIRTHARIGGG